ncbi:MAG TPA: YciI family protein [Chthoniobacterales bacterium]|nr:YciI family protein [Chthoniobacterales bacterium]
MSVQTTTSEYMLLFRGTDWDKDLSPEEIQKVMTQWTTWLERLTQEGKVKAAQPLANQGKIVSWKRGQTVADGPFAESKEAIGGYFLLRVSLDEAIEIAKQCPALKYGVNVEVRPIIDQCSSQQKVNELFARA